MNNKTHDKNRRAILKGLVGLPLLAIVGLPSTSYAAMLSADDPTAKMLNYTDKSMTAGKTCANCGIYQGGAKSTGACPIFPGKDVAATGWCKSWVAQS